MSQTPIEKILVFIPAYRCEDQLPRVLSQFTSDIQKRIHTVLLVDNISPDQTLEIGIAKGRAQFHDCRFLAWKNQENYGLGGSHKVAFQYAIENGFDALIVLHGDDQANFPDIIPFLERGAERGLDCFLGARFMEGSQLLGYSAFRTFGNKVYNLLFSLATARRLSDLGSGLNYYRVPSLRQIPFEKFPDDLTFNYVMLLASCFLGQQVQFFPISWREEDQRSNVKLFSQAVRVLKLLTRFRISPTRFLQEDHRLRMVEKYTGSVMFDNGYQRT